jgi:5-methyltetrahydrofolate--homocysteine methyltransferase
MADYEQLKQLVIDGDGEGTIRVTRQLIDSGAGAREILDGGLLPAMDIVGQRMRSGESFIPEVLLSARTMQGALDILKPLLAEGDTGNTGTAVIGTVEGDLHDIGKNLVAMMLEGAGFKVVNLGTGVTVAQFIIAVKQHKPQIVGMSALLTTTVGRMSEVIAALAP